MFGFNAGLSALSAARLGIQTVGHNLANASTPGYARQRVNLQTAPGVSLGNLRIGGGVNASGIERVTDELLTGRVRNQQQEVGRRTVALGILTDIESAFAEPGDSGIAAHLTTFFSNLSSFATTPENPQRDAAIQGAVSLTERIRQVRGELSNLSRDVRTGISDVVGEVNRITGALAAINRQIAQAGSPDGAPLDLADRQTQLLEELSEFVKISVRDVGGGRLSVAVGGQALVTYNEARELDVRRNGDGDLEVFIKKSPNAVDVTGGRLRALLDLGNSGAQQRIDQIDAFTKALQVEFNRRHATGVPQSGGYTTLTATQALVDHDGDGDFTDRALSDAGLLVPLQAGELTVSVRNRATGNLTQSRITIDPDNQTVADFIAAINAIDDLNASVDSSGRLVISASSGRDFHFAAVVDPQPDNGGTFGAKAAQITGTSVEPFALTDPSTFTVEVDGGIAQTVTLTAADFADITQATTDELVTAINSQITGATARNVGGSLVIASDIDGSSSSLLVTDGANGPAAAIGLSTTAESGSDVAVSVSAGGRYVGTSNDVLTFRPTSNGTIGVTPGLTLEVVNSLGAVIATIDVGDDYSPGSDIDLGNGVKVSFSPGDVSADANDHFSLTVTAESDSADVLTAFGLNAFFSGSSAADIAVAEDILDDPTHFAVALDDAIGDGQNVNRLLTLREASSDLIGDVTLADYYRGVVSDVGRETSRAALSFETQTQLLDSLKSRLEEVRGVSIDEELTDLQRFEQAYQAAARFISAVNDVTQILLNL